MINKNKNNYFKKNNQTNNFPFKISKSSDEEHSSLCVFSDEQREPWDG